jgi:hypothetical protein
MQLESLPFRRLPSISEAQRQVNDRRCVYVSNYYDRIASAVTVHRLIILGN